MSDEKSMGQVIQIDEARIRDHLGEMVRGTVLSSSRADSDIGVIALYHRIEGTHGTPDG